MNPTAWIGKRVHVHAPRVGDVPASDMHNRVVTIRGISPAHPEVWRTSGGPLQWTRPQLRLTPC